MKTLSFISLCLFFLMAGPTSHATDELGHSVVHGNSTITSFRKAKRILEDMIYHDHRVTFYCGCAFDDRGNIPVCGNYTPKKPTARANRLEWDHVVPAEAFGQSFPEWRQGDPACVDSRGRLFKGRNCARKISTEFRHMESDLYNLVPTIGEINRLKSNHSFGMVPGEPREFGVCDMEIADGKVEPGDNFLGDVARTYLYMDAAYPGHGVISDKNRQLFEAWDRMDPVDAWECERSARIEKIQGNENPFVNRACLEAKSKTESGTANR